MIELSYRIVRHQRLFWGSLEASYFHCEPTKLLSSIPRGCISGSFIVAILICNDEDSFSLSITSFPKKAQLCSRRIGQEFRTFLYPWSCKVYGDS